MANTWILYKDCKVIPEKNFKVDDLDLYLKTLSHIEIIEVQYIKHELALTIKLNMSQDYLEFFDNYNNINYMQIQNQSDYMGYPVYYFVTKKTWIAEKTIMLTLVMDTINTFTEERDSFTWSDRTLVNREMKDRYNYVEGDVIYRLIDLYSEGLTPVLFKHEVGNVKDDGLDWYLVYMNQNDPSDVLTNPVHCYLCASSEFEVTEINAPFDPTTMQVGEYYTLLFEENSKAVIYVDGKGYSLRSDRRYNAVFWKASNNQIYLKMCEWREEARHFAEPYWKQKSVRGSSISVDGAEGYYKLNAEPTSSTLLSSIRSTPFTTFTGRDVYTVATINTLDRTNAKIIKIIKLPYAPTSVEGDISGVWEFDSTFNFLRLKDLNTKFYNEFKSDKGNPIYNNIVLDLAPFQNYTTETPKDISNESKLYHSDYYQPKFVYDSFSYVFQLERVDPYSIHTDFDIEFIVTSTINSRFMFVFPSYKLDEYKGSQDYDNVLPIARNNEITIYNQQYMNYLRTGFNYDVKTKNRQEIASVIGTGLNLAGAIASFASVGATGGIGIASGISFLAGTASSVISTVNSVAQAEQNMEAKLTQLRMQSTSVSGADDVDLMSYYTSNKAKFVLYVVSPKMRKALWDMFFYTGYISGEMKIPNQHTRVWFDFLSCEAQFEMTNSIPDNCLDNLKERYRGGVTIMHHHNNKWNWERTFENWELSLRIADPVEGGN